jgi:branched-subunit amino acid aminotransferase/4-amino-4-deoxychorismate lyase
MSQVWVNGRLVPSGEPVFRADDHGVLVGDGVFETAKVVGGVPFALTRHLGRLRRSAGGLGLDLGLSDDELRAAVEAVISANGEGVGRLRMTVTGGPGPLGSARGEDGPTIVLATGPASAWPPSTDVAVVPWPRNERSAVAGLKTISYAENVVALAHAHDQGAGEAIFSTLDTLLCEGTGSNVFVGLGGRLVTPPLSSGCLAGITRELVLEVTDAVEQDVTMSDFLAADEAFLTSSTRDVHPIASIDGQPLPACPGPLTTAAASAFRELEARTLDP